MKFSIFQGYYFFTEAGVDETIFREIDDEMLNVLFERAECGFKKRFCLMFDGWKNSMQNPSNNINASEIPPIQNNTSLVLSLNPNENLNRSNQSMDLSLVNLNDCSLSDNSMSVVYSIIRMFI